MTCDSRVIGADWRARFAQSLHDFNGRIYGTLIPRQHGV